MTVAELLIFPASRAYLKDSSIIYKLLEILKTKEGHVKSYHGLEVEDPTKAYMVILWETYEHHKAAMDAPDYHLIIDALQPALGGSVKMYHVPFPVAPDATLLAPLTEVAFIPLRDGQPRVELEKTVIDLCAHHDKTSGCHPPCTWAYSREKEDTIVLFVGWDTVEDHERAAEAKSLQSIINRVLKYASSEASFGHARLNGY